MSSVTDRFKSKLKAALAGEKARTELNGFLKKKVVSDADLVGCFRLYLTGVTEERRVEFDSDTRQCDRAIGYALWSRTIELASDLNGFADLALFTASTARSDPAGKRANLFPPRELMDLPALFLHWDDLAFSSPVDPRPEIEQKSQKKRQEILDARGMISPLPCYAVIDDGQPKLVTEAERNAIEGARPKAKPFMEDALARYVVPVKHSATGAVSWFRDVYVGAGSRDDFRDNLTKILTNEPEGPLSKALLRNGKLVPGGVKGQDATYWAKHPELIQAGHVLSDNAGGPQMLIVMSTHNNQKFSNNLESSAAGVGKPGQLLVEDAYVIQGVAVHRGTAHDLVREGLLDAAVVRNAELIRFVD